MTDNYEYLLWVFTLIMGMPVLIMISTLCSFGIYVASRFKGWEDFDEDPESYRGQKIQGKMILWWLRYYGSYLPEFYRKPLYLCMTCMGSVWSFTYCFAYALLLMPQWWYVFLIWPLVIPAVSGINSWLAFNLKTE